MKIYFTFNSRPDLNEPLAKEFPEIDFVFHDRLEESELVDTDVLVTYGEDLNDHRIEISKQLKWIFVVSAGIEKMPAQKIAERGILVSNVRGIHKKPMSESIIAHILSLKRALPFVYENQKKGEWNKKTRLSELNGSTALIIGPGAIGAEIGRLLQAFEVYTIGLNRSGQPAPYMNETYRIDQLKEQLPKAEIIISMLPSTKETKNLLTYDDFKLMRKDAIFMNFGRGDLVSLDELVRILEDELIYHAVLDVYEIEPLPPEHKLWKFDNVTISPHFSSHSSRYLERSFEIFRPSLKKWLSGDFDVKNKMDILRGY